MARFNYREIPESMLPDGLRFDTPLQHQGQIVEVSYAAYPTCAEPACAGDRYKRVEDRSDRSVTYYERV